MTREHKLTVRISEEEFRPVRVKAAELHRPISEIVRGLLRAWVAGEVETPPPEEDQPEQE